MLTNLLPVFLHMKVCNVTRCITYDHFVCLLMAFGCSGDVTIILHAYTQILDRPCISHSSWLVQNRLIFHSSELFLHRRNAVLSR